MITTILYMFLVVSPAPPPPAYEKSNFYTYDASHRRQALPLQRKVFVYEDKTTPRTITATPAMATPRNAPSWSHLPSDPVPGGKVYTCKDAEEALELMRRLAKDSVRFEPVVKWEGMDSVPSQTIIIRAKPFVTQHWLRKRLEQVAKISIVSLEYKKENWLLTVDGVYSPGNVLMLANLISEDTGWVEWARVDFTAVFAAVSGTMYVTTPGGVNLGHERQLNVTIMIRKPSVKIDKNLLPKFGDTWRPGVWGDNNWNDFGPTTVTEETFDGYSLIRMKTPYRYLMYGTVSIETMRIPYEDGKKKLFFDVPGITYQTTSVIEGTNLNDLQEMPEFPPVVVPPVPTVVADTILPWSYAGVSTILFGICLLSGLAVTEVLRRRHVGKDKKGEVVRVLWREFMDAVTDANSSPRPEYWRQNYEKINAKFARLRKAVNMVNAENLLAELEKMYQKEAEPQPQVLLREARILAGYYDV